MKIGLLTYYSDLNCGTNMQALAIFQAIKKVYPKDDVESCQGWSRKRHL